MDVRGKISCSNSVLAHCISNITISDAVHLLHKLLSSSIFNETEIKNKVALLKQIKNDADHCKDLNETLLEKESFTQGVDESSVSAADVDEIIKRAETFLDILADQALKAKFNGETVDWFRFWEAFKSEIHSREDLPVALKFACLKERLEGWPLNMLEKLGSEGSVFDVALNLLQTTFSNKEVLIESHLNALLNLDPATATPDSLLQFSSMLEYHIKALKTYGKSVEELNSIVTSILCNKLPVGIWNSINKADNINCFSLNELQNALKFEIELLNIDCCEQENNDFVVETRNVSGVTVDDSDCKSETEDIEDSAKYSLMCQFCSGYHLLSDCTLFRTPAEKMERTKQLGSCLLCFSADHTTDECLGTGCKVCDGRHSTLFCFSGTSEPKSEKTKRKKKNHSCQLCSHSHFITGCTVYKTSVEKLERAKELKLCLLCIKDKHLTENCLRKGGCKFCKEKHNTLLCVSANSEICNKLCIFCSGSHAKDICSVYKTSADKLERSKELKLCLLCLKEDHLTEKCLKKRGCKLCKERHSSLLCVTPISEVCNTYKSKKRNKVCVLCSGSHDKSICSIYKTSAEKLVRSIELKLCLLCLKDDHLTEKCLKKRGCKFCKERHSSLLCVTPISEVFNTNKSKKRNKVCVLCSGSHYKNNCSVYKTSAEMLERSKELKLCLLCFKDDHLTEKCLKKRCCKLCKERHSPLLCVLSSKVCPLCSECHKITGCTIYKTTVEKMERAVELNLCLMCLNSDHTTEKCVITAGCKVCKGKHTTLLCNSEKIVNINKPSKNKKQENLQCSLCFGSDHHFGGCPIFNVPFKRQKRAEILNLCLLCLGDNHGTSECLIEKCCKHCKERHNPQLCLQKPKPKKSFICTLCSGNHHSFGCLKYTTPVQRRGRAEALNLCLVCTSNEHLSSECPKTDVCKACHARHHSLLCVNVKAKINRRRRIRQEKQGSLCNKGERVAACNNSLILDFIASSSI